MNYRFKVMCNYKGKEIVFGWAKSKYGADKLVDQVKKNLEMSHPFIDEDIPMGFDKALWDFDMNKEMS